MKTEIRRLGDEYLVLIPREVVDHMGLDESTTIIVRVLGDEILLTPSSPEELADDVDEKPARVRGTPSVS